MLTVKMKDYHTLYQKYSYELDRVNHEDLGIFHGIGASVIDNGIFFSTVIIAIWIYQHI